jgi:hypothetical protein
MGLIDRLRGDRDEDDWRARRGRYAGLDPDAPDRVQVKPAGRRDDVQEMTHHVGPDGIRRAEGDDSGPWREDDDG